MTMARSMLIFHRLRRLPLTFASFRKNCTHKLTIQSLNLSVAIRNQCPCVPLRRFDTTVPTPGSLQLLDRPFSNGLLKVRRQCLLQNQASCFSTGPNKSRVKNLMVATYVSCMVGGVLLSLVAYRFYGRFKKRARGIEDLDVPLFGRRSRVLCRYRGYSLPSNLVNTIVNDVPWFEVRPDDVWVVSFPKAGTTWLQEIVYLISTGYDYDKARAANLEERFPYLEFPYPGHKALAEKASPRFIKSHLPVSLLPKELNEKKPKIIYIARNPKDTVVSLLAFTKMSNFVKFLGDQDDFAQLFLDGTVFYGPWEKHVQEAWERKDDENVLFITYESLQKDFQGTVKDIAKFLDKPLLESQLTQLETHCSFESMRSNNSVNYSWQQGKLWSEGQFMRKADPACQPCHLEGREELLQYLVMTPSHLMNCKLHFCLHFLYGKKKKPMWTTIYDYEHS